MVLHVFYRSSSGFPPYLPYMVLLYGIYYHIVVPYMEGMGESLKKICRRHGIYYHIVVSYMEGMGESLKKICRRHGVDMHFKGGRTLKNILVSPKDEEKITNKNCVIYSYSCGSIDCGEEYIGESGRSFGERYKEHLKAPSPIFQHQSSSGHATSIDNFKIIGREDNSLARTIKESIYIRVNNPTLNRNIGKYNLPHIWDNLLFNIPELKMK